MHFPSGKNLRQSGNNGSLYHFHVPRKHVLTVVYKVLQDYPETGSPFVPLDVQYRIPTAAFPHFPLDRRLP